MKFALTLLALFLLATVAAAGPVRDRLKARFSGTAGNGCQSCPQAQAAPVQAYPQYNPYPQYQPYGYAVPQQMQSLPQFPYSSPCQGGRCPVPR